LVLEKVIREIKIGPNEGIREQDTLIGLLAYADDIVLMEESKDRLKILFSRLYKAASKVRLRVNKGPLCQSIKTDHCEFKRVEQFK